MKKENFYQTKIKPQIKKGIDEIRHPGNHPKTTALSISIGIFVGIAVPMGFQVWAMALLLLVVRYNLMIASLVSLISNPLTVLPIYFVVISIGEYVIGVNFPWDIFYDFIDDPGIEKILEFGEQGIAVFFTGSILIALVISIPTYFVSLKTITALHKKNVNTLEQS